MNPQTFVLPGFSHRCVRLGHPVCERLWGHWPEQRPRFAGEQPEWAVQGTELRGKRVLLVSL